MEEGEGAVARRTPRVVPANFSKSATVTARSRRRTRRGEAVAILPPSSASAPPAVGNGLVTSLGGFRGRYRRQRSATRPAPRPSANAATFPARPAPDRYPRRSADPMCGAAPWTPSPKWTVISPSSLSLTTYTRSVGPASASESTFLQRTPSTMISMASEVLAICPSQSSLASRGDGPERSQRSAWRPNRQVRPVGNASGASSDHHPRGPECSSPGGLEVMRGGPGTCWPGHSALPANWVWERLSVGRSPCWCRREQRRAALGAGGGPLHRIALGLMEARVRQPPRSGGWRSDGSAPRTRSASVSRWSGGSWRC